MAVKFKTKGDSFILELTNIDTRKSYFVDGYVYTNMEIDGEERKCKSYVGDLMRSLLSNFTPLNSSYVDSFVKGMEDSGGKSLDLKIKKTNEEIVYTYTLKRESNGVPANYTITLDAEDRIVRKIEYSYKEDFDTLGYADVKVVVEYRYTSVEIILPNDLDTYVEVK